MRYLSSRVLVLFICLMLGWAPLGELGQPDEAAASTHDISYVYDEVGRLTGVVDPATGAAGYVYDSVGNTTSITRTAATATSILEFSPNEGPAGTTVTLWGTGFSTTASENSVSFNGATAAVTSASATKLTATVPAGATSGAVTVTAPSGSATSREGFTVRSANAPAISAVTPAVANPGSSVTISGTNFGPAPADNPTRIGPLYAPVTEANSTQVVATVPSGIGSGRIQLTTAAGRAEADLFIPPPGFVASDVEATGRVGFDESRTLTISTPNKIGLLIFSGTANQRVSIKWGTVNPSGSVYSRLLRPDGTTLVDFGRTYNNEFQDTITLPVDGTYTVLIDHSSDSTGSVTLQRIYNVPPDPTASTTIDGDPVTVTPSVPGQNATITFTGSANQRISVKWGSVNPSGSVFARLLRPDGTTLADFGRTYNNSFDDTVTLPASGTYTLLIDPDADATGSVTLQRIYNVPPDPTASTTIDGDPVTVTPSVPGQNATITFSGSANQRISVKWGSVNPSGSVFARLLRPDGTTLADFGRTYNNSFDDTVTLPASGTYTLLIDPDADATGSVTLQRIHNVPPDATATAVIDGDPVTVTASVPGQNANITFSGSANQRISIKWGSVNPSGSVFARLLRPDGTTLADFGRTYTNEFQDTMTLPVNGTYKLLIDPDADATGSVTLQRIYDASYVLAAITINGSSVTVTCADPGEDARVTFSGTAGQAITLTLSAVTIGQSDVSIQRPNGTNLVAPTYVTTTGKTITATLNATGTHTILVNPRGEYTGNMTLTLTSATGSTGAPATFASWTAPVAVGDTNASRTAAAGVIPSSSSFSVPQGPLVDGDGPPVDDLNDHDIPDEEWIPGPENFDGDWRSGWPQREPDPVDPLLADRDVTALSGRIVALNGRPIKGVTVAIEDVTTVTDREGRFLLADLEPGHHELWVESPTFGNGKTYGMYEIGVDVPAGDTMIMPYTIWLPKISRAGAVDVPSSPTTEDIVITTPHIPGLEVHIPAGSVISDENWEPVSEISITPIPVDRTPFPLPENEIIPVYFTIQPGGAYVEPYGARIIYPNYTDLPPGTQTAFWNYEPDGRGWYVYGHGTVSADGTQVIPNPGVRIYEFTGAMFNDINWPVPSFGPEPGDKDSDGDPVDLSSGLFVLNKTDLVLPGVLPVSLTRTYRPSDSAVRAFGIGTTHAYQLWLWSAQQYQEVDLILPDGGRVHYERISAGTGWEDAVFEHTATPSEFYLSRITWNGNGWDLKLQDGTVYVFGDNAPLTAIRDRYGNAITITRTGDSFRNITQVSSSSGRWIKFTYDASNRVTAATDNTGRTVAYVYDANGRLWKVTDPAGGVTEYTYDASHRMLTIKDARGIVFLTNEYDANSRVVRQTQADGTTYQFAYTVDANGRVTQTDVTDPRGFVRRVTFNATGYTTSDTYAVGRPEEQTVTYERAAGTQLVTAVVDELGRRTALAYDGAGNVTSVTRLAGTANAVTTSFTYEPAYQQIATVTDPLNHTTSFGYDALGNLTSVTDPLGNRTSMSYHATGVPVSVTQPDGSVTRLTYEYGDLVRSTDPLGNTVTSLLDGAGRVVRSTDPLGHATRYAFDALNRPTAVTDALGAVTSFTYDRNGNLLSLTDARGNATAYAYDSMDRVERFTDPLLAAESYAYDADGNVTRVTDRNGEVTAYSYDALGRLTFAGFDAVTTGGSTTYESTITYTYDAGNRLTSLADSASGTITLAYDGLDRLTSETNPQGTVSWAYDAADRRTSMTVAGQPTVNYSYDNADRLTQITQGSSTVALAYDTLSRRSSLTLPNGIVLSYVYDAASRLTGIVYSRAGTTLGDLTYAYDAAGRRTHTGGTFARTGIPAAVSTTAYDAANRLTQWGTATLTYDAAGNMTSDGSRTYTWNARGELAEISTGTNVTASFAYDALGRRIGATLDGTSTSFVYDGANIVQELSGTTPTANLLSGGIDEVFTRTDAAGARSLLADALGSTVALADSAGVIGTTYTYEPFGKTTTAGPTSTNAFQFTGRENDGTGLYYYRARYYHPTFGRFISEDPLGFAAGDTNLYAYVGNSPTNATDPSGEIPLPIATCAFGAVVGMITQAVMHGRKTNLGDLALGAGAGCAIGATLGMAAPAMFAVTAAVGPPAIAALSNASATASQGGTSVYRALDSAGLVRYVGITNDLARRAAEHLSSKGISITRIPGLTNLSRPDARAVEQALIEIHGLGRNGGTLVNRINSIAQSNPIYADALRRGMELLQQAGYPIP